MDAIGLYIHIPFCRAKCAYCDFNSYAGLEDLFGDYAAALAREMEQAGPARVRTIYVGGGTPTVLPLSHLVQILEAARRAFVVDLDAEVSIEANPGTVNGGTLASLRALGVNRLSLGVQSLDGAELRLLGRIHTAAEAVAAFGAVRQAGFENLNLDLIYGLPGQAIAAWQETLERALALEPDHLSLYALGVEEGTPLAAAIAQGVLPEPDPDLAAEMYEWAEDTLAAAGYLHYEISNWAREPRFQCRHNLTYWRNEPSRGVGAGAHSWLGGRRWANVAHPAEYAARFVGGRCPAEAEEKIGPALEMGETMMMGLRLLDEGVPFARFRERFGEDLRQRFSGELTELAELGLIATDDQRIRLSRRGRLLGNQVFLRFLPEQSNSHLQ
jgi:oxygen-independent coproporphyrinogen-3 oxidase